MSLTMQKNLRGFFFMYRCIVIMEITIVTLLPFTIQGESKNFCHYIHATKYKIVVITIFLIEV